MGSNVDLGYLVRAIEAIDDNMRKAQEPWLSQSERLEETARALRRASDTVTALIEDEELWKELIKRSDYRPVSGFLRMHFRRDQNLGGLRIPLTVEVLQLLGYEREVADKLLQDQNRLLDEAIRPSLRNSRTDPQVIQTNLRSLRDELRAMAETLSTNLADKREREEQVAKARKRLSFVLNLLISTTITTASLVPEVQDAVRTVSSELIHLVKRLQEQGEPLSRHARKRPAGEESFYIEPFDVIDQEIITEKPRINRISLVADLPPNEPTPKTPEYRLLWLELYEDQELVDATWAEPQPSVFTSVVRRITFAMDISPPLVVKFARTYKLRLSNVYGPRLAVYLAPSAKPAVFVEHSTLAPDIDSRKQPNGAMVLSVD